MSDWAKIGRSFCTETKWLSITISVSSYEIFDCSKVLLKSLPEMHIADSTHISLLNCSNSCLRQSIFVRHVWNFNWHLFWSRSIRAWSKSSSSLIIGSYDVLLHVFQNDSHFINSRTSEMIIIPLRDWT